MTVNVPISKSCYARIATICAIAGIDIPYSDENDDVIAIRQVLQPVGNRIYVGSSGTATRFAIAYYSSMDCDVIIDGSSQMRKRPVSSIIEAVRTLGAVVEGESLPLRIKGHFWKKCEVEVDASQSSQTISALMLAGMRSGLRIKTRGERNSWSYVELTADVMRKFGIDVGITDTEVRVGKMGVLTQMAIEVEKDWSSAVFWYGWCATRGEEVFIPWLSGNSGQPDKAAMEIFGRLGVHSEESAEGMLLTKTDTVQGGLFVADCRQTPDLAMVLIPTLCRLGRSFRITGLDTLDRKESRRGEALCCELRKSGYVVEWDGCEMSGSMGTGTYDPQSEALGHRYLSPLTHDDHRMVMAHLILGNKVDLASLNKSYPALQHFFEKKFGGSENC